MADLQAVELDTLREEMVEQIELYFRELEHQIGFSRVSPRVREVMRAVPRHEFVPEELRAMAYLDSPLPIGCGKTISQPFIVALMTELLEVEPGDKVLEVGTGLGYQAAILAALAGLVYTVEIVDELAKEAEHNLAAQEIQNIQLGVGDGSSGWQEHAPFDKILVAAAPELIPPPLLNQLKPGGRMVVPAGLKDAQQLMLVEKDAGGKLKTTEILQVRFSALEVAH